MVGDGWWFGVEILWLVMRWYVFCCIFFRGLGFFVYVLDEIVIGSMASNQAAILVDLFLDEGKIL